MSDSHQAVGALPGKSRFGWRFRIAITLLLLAVLAFVIPVIFLLRNAHLALQTAISEADQTDPGRRFPEIEANRLQVPDNENMANVVIKVRQLTPGDWPYWDMHKPYMNLSVDQIDELARSFDELEPPKRLSAQQTRELRAELGRNDSATKEALKTLEMRHGRFTLTYGPGINILSTLIPGTQDTRLLARVLAYLAKMRAEDNDADGALTACRAILLSQRAVGDEPFFISALVKMAVRAIACENIERTLAQTQPSEALLAQLQSLVKEELDDNLLLTGARGERGVSDYVMEDLQGSPFTAQRKLNLIQGLASSKSAGTSLINFDSLLTLIPGAMSANRAAILQFNNRSVAAAGLPVEQQRQAFKELEESTRELPPVAKLLAGAVGKLAQAYRRNVAQLRCILVLLAAERYRRATGKLPESISDLVPQYLESVPTDPFDAQSLRLKHFKDGIVIYSIGENCVDDGGSVAKATPSANVPLDFGYRLWEVRRRRQSP